MCELTLVTGAAGFVGEHLFRHLSLKQHHVVGTIRNRSIEVSAEQLTRVDLTNPSSVIDLIKKHRPSRVIHSAALTNIATCELQPEQAERDIVLATKNVVAACRQVCPESIIVLLSTDQVYDGSAGGYSAYSTAHPLSVYGKCKLAAEQLVLSHARGIVVRSALVFGPPSTYSRSFLGWMIDTLRAGRSVPLFVDEYRSPILVRDLCTAVDRLAELGERGVFVAGGLDKLNRLEMGQIVAGAFNLPSELLSSTKLADAEYPAPRPQNVTLDSRATWQRIAHEPTSFSDAVRELADRQSFG